MICRIHVATVHEICFCSYTTNAGSLNEGLNGSARDIPEREREREREGGGERGRGRREKEKYHGYDTQQNI